MNRLAIVLSHPIQYYAPIFSLLNKTGKCKLKVFYTYSQGQESIKDKDFRMDVKWDIPLLEGYKYTFVKNCSKSPKLSNFKGIHCPTLISEIEQWAATHLIIFGWNYQAHLKAMRYFKGKIPVLFRGDSTLLDYDFQTIKDITNRNKSVNLSYVLKSFIKFNVRFFFLSWVYKHIDTALYVGQNNKAYFLAHGLKEKKLVFAPHAIDNERFHDSEKKKYEIKASDWRKELGIQTDDITILFAGKFEHKKNPVLLLNAFKQLAKNHSNIKLVFLGNGLLEKQLKTNTKEDKNILFVPFQNQSIMPVAYRLGNILCLPSQGPGETWGLAVNEAMACGRPALVSNKVGCAKDLITHKTGLIFQSNNEKDLSNKLQDMIKNLGSYKSEIISNHIQEWSFKKIVDTITSEILHAK